MPREMGKCDRTTAFCHCSACPEHCCHVCAENEFRCCKFNVEAKRMMDAKCPFCGESAEGCECHRDTHGG